jgi:hypothetical protein
MLTSVIIFSKDRPMQLDCLLCSLKKNASVPDYLSVIYKATNEEFEKGYSQILDVNMIKETNFKENVFNNLLGDYVLFLCDDDIIFKKIDFIEFSGDIACFSYRLGHNIDYCYSNAKPNILKNGIEEEGLLWWDWTQETLDFAYPLSMTAHLFSTHMMRLLLENIEFSNPNELEAKLQNQLQTLPHGMMSYDDSRIVGVPANRVNNSFENSNGLMYAYSTKELNDRFLKGERIDFEQMSYPVHSAQQELEYKFIQK